MISGRLRLRPFVSHLGRQHSSKTQHTLQRYRFAARTYHHQHVQHAIHPGFDPLGVRIIRPTLWSVAVISTIFFTCAAYDVYEDAQQYSKSSWRTLSFDQLEADRTSHGRRRNRNTPSQSSDLGSVFKSPIALWQSLDGPSQVTTGLVGVNIGVYLKRFIYPTTVLEGPFVHWPVEAYFKNRQLLGSCFGHTGGIHLAINLLAFVNVTPMLAQSPKFNHSGSHMLAFFLSGGIFGSLAAHIVARFPPNTMYRFSPHMGFSGVVAATVAAVCMEFRDVKFSALFLGSHRAHDFLQYWAAFDLAGLLGLFRLLQLPITYSFGAHLGGMAFGAAYMHYNGKDRIYTPFRRAAFRAMKTVGVI